MIADRIERSMSVTPTMLKAYWYQGVIESAIDDMIDRHVEHVDLLIANGFQLLKGNTTIENHDQPMSDVKTWRVWTPFFIGPLREDGTP